MLLCQIVTREQSRLKRLQPAQPEYNVIRSVPEWTRSFADDYLDGLEMVWKLFCDDVRMWPQ